MKICWLQICPHCLMLLIFAGDGEMVRYKKHVGSVSELGLRSLCTMCTLRLKLDRNTVRIVGLTRTVEGEGVECRVTCDF